MDKPLPNIPLPLPSKQARAAQTFARLTIESHTHLRRLIAQALRDDLDATEGKEGFQHDVWVDAITGGLQEFGSRMASGGWVAGLKRARLQTRIPSPSPSPVVTVDRKGKGKARAVDVLDGGAGEKPDVASQIANPGVQPPDPLTILHSLKEFIAKPVLPAPKPTAKHLLVTVSPLAQLAAHPQDHLIECTFSAGEFSIPSSLTAESEGIILFGLDGWDGTWCICSTQSWCTHLCSELTPERLYHSSRGGYLQLRGRYFICPTRPSHKGSPRLPLHLLVDTA